MKIYYMDWFYDYKKGNQYYIAEINKGRYLTYKLTGICDEFIFDSIYDCYGSDYGAVRDDLNKYKKEGYIVLSFGNTKFSTMLKKRLRCI